MEGARELYALLRASAGSRYERCGKLIVARDESELARLDELERRGRENGVPGLRRLDAEGLREIEPHARGRGRAALAGRPASWTSRRWRARWPPTSRAAGVPVVSRLRGHGDRAARRPRSRLRPRARRDAARFAVFCAGVWADGWPCWPAPPADPRIVPFRGAYLRLRPERRELVRGLIYPVPDPSLPFLGVHLTRHIDGEVSLGPTALLAPTRPRALAAWPGTWRMARRWWRTGVRELHHAVAAAASPRAAADYVPGARARRLRAAGFAGIRAQALARDGGLVDDFVFSQTERALHVRNAPSPAATSSLALARLIAERAEQGLD